MILDLLAPQKWQDVLDILVISILIHRLFLLFRGTSVLQIMVGLLFLWVLHGIAQAAGLVLTSWFLEGFGAIAVLVLVVVFRNEIREALIQTNPVRLFLGRLYEPQAINPAAIAQTAFQLANTKTGALLVFQNRDRLTEFLREGIPLGGIFTREITESIFARQSPVHDGAAVIRGNRIERIGTFLPLTQREGLPQVFGSRHRAAIGLTELSDAVVIAVSEERGEVSLAYRGKLEVVADPRRLERALRRLLLGVRPERKPASHVREWVTQAAGLVLTFMLVSAFWVISGKQQSLINLTVPLDFRNIPDYLELKRASAEKVEVQVTGKGRLVSALKPEQVGAFVDLRDGNSGTLKVPLSADNIRIPLGLEVVRVTPAAITVELEQRIEKEVPITPEVVGLP
ncbi:MAG TPA: diadenylate cyclase, partial [Syntrophobacteria bacterium]|nr:diadenylate cyclase [Syntrophobacteria bacterium]